MAFRGFFRACRVRGACLRFFSCVAFGSLALVVALFRLVFALGVFLIGQKEKAAKIGFKWLVMFSPYVSLEREKKKSGALRSTFFYFET